MNNQILEQIQTLIKNGQIIKAIQLVRTVKNINLKDSKEIVEKIRRQVAEIKNQTTVSNEHFEVDSLASQSQEHYSNSEAEELSTKYQHRHSHKIEKDLPTEVYLLLQQGKKLPALKVLIDKKGIPQSQALAMINQFYVENPQYVIAKENQTGRLIPRIIFLFIGIFIVGKFTGFIA